jgi:predicted acylesterase/phospholipase RssA
VLAAAFDDERLCMPGQVQIATQGGGARLVPLLALMRALEILRARHGLQVVRMAGTSAGAYANTLFAAKVPIAVARTLLLERRQLFIDRLRVKNSIPTWWKVKGGDPLWDDSLLLEPLQDLLVKHGESKSGGKLTADARFKDLPIETLTLATDLEAMQSRVHCDEDGVLSSVMSSAGLPFLFRALNSRPANPVDGGLCENLPASLLIGAEDKLGPVIGLSFPPERPVHGPDGVLRYALAVLSSAINHGTARSRQLLGPRCIEFPTDITTLDFEKALTQLDTGFDALVGDACRAIEAVLDATFKKPSAAVAAPSQELTDQDWSPVKNADALLERLRVHRLMIGNIYKTQHAIQRLDYLLGRMVVTVGAPAIQDGAVHDQIFTQITINPDDHGPVYCHRLALGKTVTPDSILDDSEITVFNSKGQRVQIMSMPMVTTEDKQMREVLVHFNPLLTAATGPYTMNCKSMFDGFVKPLRESGRDELSLRLTRMRSPIATMEIVLHYPQSFGTVEREGSNVPCEAMSAAELAAYQANLPPGYVTLGWRARNVTDKFAVQIARNLPTA